MDTPYLQTGLVLSLSTNNDPILVRALQEDLRRLGYLRGGIDGAYGSQVVSAVRALCFDLLHNDGRGGRRRS